LPYAPNRGDRTRAFHIIRTLAPRVEVDLFSLIDDEAEIEQAESLRRLGVRVKAFRVPRIRNRARALVGLAGARPLTHFLLDAPGLAPSLANAVRNRPPDVVLAYCSSMARFAIEPPLATVPLVVDLVDVDSAKWAALAPGASWPRRWIYEREARVLSSFEQEAATKAVMTFVVNERERRILEQVAPRATIRVLPAGVDLATFKPRHAPTGDNRVVFCGVMNYGPNVEGVLWFARHVWPLIRALRPDASFSVVGSDPTREIRRLAFGQTGIDVTGTVADVRPYLWKAAVSVAPLLTARGVQTKVLEAVAAGLPAVVTPDVFGGLPPEVAAACRIGRSPEAFADQVLSLLSLSGAERRGLLANANVDGLSWESRLAPLYQALVEAKGTP
jgi:sugar transferase (PEP-CTERM/EpsH1 system associated)